MSYYNKKNQPYVNSYANPNSAYSDAANAYVQQASKPKVDVQSFTNSLSTVPGLAKPIVHQPIDLTYTPKADSTPASTSSGGGAVVSDPYASYMNKIIELENKSLAEERARQERIRQARIDAANKVYDTSKGNLDAATESSLRQAYIKHRMDEKNLPQQMQAFGLSGGATETNLANMKNAYGNNRTSIMNENLAQQRLIEQDRANAIANAEADSANYEASAVRDYNNGLIKMYESALDKMPSYNNTGASSQITKNPWYDVAVGYLEDGNSTDDVIATLRQQGVSDDIIDAILYNWESTI